MKKRTNFIVLVLLMLATTLLTFNAIKGIDFDDIFPAEFDDEEAPF